MSDHLARLRESVGMFQGFSDAELVELLKDGSAQEAFEDGAIVFREGMPSSRMYVVLAGQVRITRNPGLADPEELALLDPGACFGEMGLIDPSPRSARATAVGPTTLLVVSERALKHAPAEVTIKLYRNFAGIIAARLRLANEQIVRLTMTGRKQSEQVQRLARRRSVEKGSGLRGVELDGADLSGVDLRGADLRGAVLTGAQLSEANLREADLRGVDLSGGHFYDTDLRQTNLSGANLSGCVFRGTNFEQALFAGALTSEVTVEEDLGASPEDGRKR